MHCIKIEGKEYYIPEITELTLQDRIAFDDKYGIALRKQLKTIGEMKKGTERDIEFVVYHCELAKQALSFFAKVPMPIVEQIAIEDVMIVFQNLIEDLCSELDFSNELPLKREFNWQNDQWEIQPPELIQDSIMKFGEFIDAKQSVQDLFEDNDENNKALLSLCCIYFRKKDEPYRKELPKENGERWQLLQQLPFTYAMHVGFFLNCCQNIYTTYFRYSGHPERKAQAAMSAVI